jgi:hypothetical protein
LAGTETQGTDVFQVPKKVNREESIAFLDPVQKNDSVLGGRKKEGREFFGKPLRDFRVSSSE